MKNCKYYRIKNSTINIGRAYPQVQQVTSNLMSQIKLLDENDESFINNNNIILDHFILEKSAKLTDMISVAPISDSDGILISERFKNLIQFDNIESYTFIPSILKKKDNIVNINGYYLFVPNKKGYRYLDFNHYNFYFTNERDKKFKIYDWAKLEYLRNNSELNNILKCYQFKKDNVVYVNNKFPVNLDVIYWGDSIAINQLYFSEGLRLRIENHKLSGIEFEEEVQIIVSN